MYEEVSAKLLFRAKLRTFLIKLGCIRHFKVSYLNHDICFNDLNSNSVLMQIGSYGFKFGYEYELKRFIEKYNCKIDTFIDGGANIGYYSLLFSLNHPTAKCIAVEALDRNVEYMKNLKLINSLNFEIINCAIDIADNKRIEFFVPKNIGKSKLSAIGSLNKSFRESQGIYFNINYETKEVNTITLPTLLHGSEKSLVKLDIEGNEFRVLEDSLKNLDSENIDFILEIMIYDEDKDLLFTLMRSYGYRAFLITNKGLVEEQKALTMPYPYPRSNGTLWKNHFFTKREINEVRRISCEAFGNFI